MNISIKNKFSMIIIFMSILSLIFAYLISNEVVSRNILTKEKIRLDEKSFYLNRDLELVEEKIFDTAVNIAQNRAVIDFFLEIDKLTNKKRLEKEEELADYFERRIVSREDFLKNIDVVFLDKKGNYIYNTKEKLYNERENIVKSLGLLNDFPLDVSDYVVSENSEVFVKGYSPILNKDLKEVLGGVAISYRFDKFILEYLKESYNTDIILEDKDGKYVMTTFKEDLDKGFFKENLLELGGSLYLTEKLSLKDTGINIIIAMNRKKVLDEKSEISSYLFLALFFVFSLLFIVSSTVLNVFIDSLKQLTLKINTLKDGNFNVNLGNLKNNNDEIGILAHDFENMVHILKNKIRELEEANLNNKHYSNRLEKANEDLKVSQKNLKDKSENIERINKLLNNRITEISSMYYLMVSASKFMLNDKFYDVVVKGVREGLILPKVALYLESKEDDTKLVLKNNLGFEKVSKEVNIESSNLILQKKDMVEAEEFLSTSEYGNLDNVYIFPLVSRKEKDRLYGILLISKGEKIKQEFKKSILTYVNALLLAIENRTLYLQLMADNRKLEETTKELQESEKMKNIFISNISHELRIPLVPIKGYHEIILEERMGRLNPKQRKAMKTSLKNIERLQEIIENILNYSRIESGKYQILNTILKIEDVFEEVILRLGNLIEENEVNLIRDYTLNGAYIYADKEALKQIFINLISNSIKFGKEEGVTIKLSIIEQADCYKICIKDNGVGMDKSKIEQVLKSFRQLEEGNTRKYRGLGLGLTVVDKILAYYGEKIYMNSKRENGTEVYFFFKKGDKINEVEYGSR